MARTVEERMPTVAKMPNSLIEVIWNNRSVSMPIPEVTPVSKTGRPS